MVEAEMFPISQGLKPTTSLGDLAQFSPDMRTHVLNAVLVEAMKKRTTLDDLRVQEEAQRLKEKLTDFNIYVHNPNNYTAGARATIKRLYQEADDRTLGSNMDTRVAARVNPFEGTHVVMDYDNTISDNDKPLDFNPLIRTDSLDHLVTLIPGSAIAEPMLRDMGRDKFAEVYASVWQFFLKDEIGKRIFWDAGSHVPSREGVNSFFSYAKNKYFNLTIVSANFEPYVMGGLDRIPEANGVNVFAVKPDSIISTQKDDLLFHLAQKDPKSAILYVGDGASDLPALEARDVIACYFALEGSKFADALSKNNLPHFTYKNFYAITSKLQQLSMTSRVAVAA